MGFSHFSPTKKTAPISLSQFFLRGIRTRVTCTEMSSTPIQLLKEIASLRRIIKIPLNIHFVLFSKVLIYFEYAYSRDFIMSTDISKMFLLFYYIHQNGFYNLKIHIDAFDYLFPPFTWFYPQPFPLIYSNLILFLFLFSFISLF